MVSLPSPSRFAGPALSRKRERGRSMDIPLPLPPAEEGRGDGIFPKEASHA